VEGTQFSLPSSELKDLRQKGVGEKQYQWKIHNFFHKFLPIAAEL
jgi:hypothetical protein